MCHHRRRKQTSQPESPNKLKWQMAAKTPQLLASAQKPREMTTLTHRLQGPTLATRMQQPGLPSYLHHPSHSKQKKNKKRCQNHDSLPRPPRSAFTRPLPQRAPELSQDGARAAPARGAVQPLVSVGPRAEPAPPCPARRAFQKPAALPSGGGSAAWPGNVTFLRDGKGTARFPSPPAEAPAAATTAQSEPASKRTPRCSPRPGLPLGTPSKNPPPQNQGLGGLGCSPLP